MKTNQCTVKNFQKQSQKLWAAKETFVSKMRFECPKSVGFVNKVMCFAFIGNFGEIVSYFSKPYNIS